MGQKLTKNMQFARENKGGTWVGQKMLGTEESDHIACANMYLVAVERLIKLEDQLEILKKAHSDQLAETDYCYVCGEHSFAHNKPSKCPIGA